MLSPGHTSRPPVIADTCNCGGGGGGGGGGATATTGGGGSWNPPRQEISVGNCKGFSPRPLFGIKRVPSPVGPLGSPKFGVGVYMPVTSKRASNLWLIGILTPRPYWKPGSTLELRVAGNIVGTPTEGTWILPGPPGL